MQYLKVCPNCKGEGYKNYPRYDWNYAAATIKVHAKSPCNVCGGPGYIPATQPGIEEWLKREKSVHV